ILYAFNRNKQSVVVDLESAEGQTLIYRLAGESDILVENLESGFLQGLGYGYGDLAAVNPGIVYCSLKGFLSGPYEQRATMDTAVQYQSGLAYMTGPLGDYLRAGASIIDIMGAMFGVIGIEAAINQRRRSGTGQLVETAQFETAAFLVCQHMASEAASGDVPLPMGIKKERGGAWAIYETFGTKDGESIFIGLTSDNHWRGFWGHFDRPDLIEDERFATNRQRVAERPTTVPLVAEVAARHNLAELVEICDRVNVPFSPVSKPGDLFGDIHLTAGGRMPEIQFPGGKTAPMPHLPVEIGAHHLGHGMQAPEAGQHSREILAGLGLSETEIEDLGCQGVVHWPELAMTRLPSAGQAPAPAAGNSPQKDGPPKPTELPLNGIRVLEFCHTVMGPSAGAQLADLGADVIKVEAITGSDRLMHLRGASLNWNRNKRSLSVDLKSDAGRALIYKLAEKADVLIENYGPGTLDRLGYGYKDLSRINPRIVFCALKGFLSGPYEHRPALDEVVQYMAGLAYMTGTPGAPTRVGASVIDIVGGMFGVIALLAALTERERTGHGQFVKSSLFESTAFLVTEHMAGEAITGNTPLPIPEQTKSGSEVWAIGEPFETKDGEQIFIGLTNDRHWRAFWERFGRPDLIEGADYASNALRVANRQTTRPIAAAQVKEMPLAEMQGICTEISIPFAPLVRPGNLFDDPHLLEGGRMLGIEFADRGTFPIPSLPLEMGGRGLGLRRQAPKLGLHTSELLLELGLTEGEIGELAADGTVLLGEAEA
ncbi:MAG: CaiB/BaiF CoA-transferase family protein, partial [Rhodospirillales bacterium]|nr:CaiB/BaiF CoA-transferase family protein [Rhodospirillales bacterium]